MSHLFDMDASAVAATTDDWYTPHWLFEAAGITFDMDVAAPIDPAMRTVPAKRHLTILDDGLETEWGGGGLVQSAVLKGDALVRQVGRAPRGPHPAPRTSRGALEGGRHGSR